MSISVLQKNFAFTSSDSKLQTIKTGSFGPCYVVTFTSGKFAAMAHIDDNTNVESIDAIFNRFRENSIHPSDLKVIILGGWKEHSESVKWGEKIVQKITDAGVQNLSVKNMHKKKKVTAQQREAGGISASEISDYFYYGAVVDAKDASTYLLKKPDLALEEEQSRRTEQWIQDHGVNSNIEYPLTQITG